MKPIIHKSIHNNDVLIYFLVIGLLILTSILGLSKITKPQTTSGYLTVIKKQDSCYYVFNSIHFLSNKYLDRIIINYQEEVILSANDYQIENTRVVFNTVISCFSYFYYQPATIIYSEQSLLSYFYEIFSVSGS